MTISARLVPLGAATILLALALAGGSGIALAGDRHAKHRDGHEGDNRKEEKERGLYVKRNLVSDGCLSAEHTDPNLVNAWGIAAGPSTPWWVADNGTGVSTLYDGDGNPQPPAQPLVVTVNGTGNPPGKAAPTGIAFNGSSSFVVSQGGASGPARFMFASEDGTISGWNPGVLPPRRWW
jgi:hypothetical protein